MVVRISQNKPIVGMTAWTSLYSTYTKVPEHKINVIFLLC